MVLRAFLLMYLQYRIDMYAYPNFFDHLFMLPLKFFQQRSTGDILMRVSSNNTIRDIVSTQFLSTILDGSLVVVYLIILLWQSWLFTLVVLILGILQFVLLLGANNEYRLRSAHELETIGKSQGYVAEILAGMTTVKAAGAEQRVFQKWFNLFADQLNASLRQSYLASLLSTSISLLRIVSPLLLLWLGVIQVLNGTMPLGTMIALNSLAGAFVTPLTSLASSATQLPVIRSHLERLSDVMEADTEQEVLQAQEPPRLTGRIQLQDVGFKYDANSPPVLKDITIDIAPGQKIAIVGPTGSGKSTLGKLLLGLYLPTEGEILYDGIPLRSLNYQSVRSQFGVIMQDASIFSGSIWQNIAFNNPDMNMESISKAAKLAALDGDIQQMPMGYETYVGEAGNTLSGGQRQRLAIARALANDPSILLLDEATSALDVITEQMIEQNLKSLSCTQIIIAHRLSTVREADVILVLDQGHIVESGSHAELLAKEGYYAKLTHNQLA
jgi:ABC-type bacteriocin/lantibiotic exporter with double-glycine peptidase domain